MHACVWMHAEVCERTQQHFHTTRGAQAVHLRSEVHCTGGGGPPTTRYVTRQGTSAELRALHVYAGARAPTIRHAPAVIIKGLRRLRLCQRLLWRRTAQGIRPRRRLQSSAPAQSLQRAVAELRSRRRRQRGRSRRRMSCRACLRAGAAAAASRRAASRRAPRVPSRRRCARHRRQRLAARRIWSCSRPHIL